MAWTDEETRRIQRLENAIAEHTQAIRNLASKRQMNHTLSLVNSKIAQLETALENLQSQLDALKR